mgnify:FL=1
MIELNNITYIVEDKGNKKVILDNISIKFEDNCITAITGQNGSGKSTLTKIIIGIIRPTSGQIIYNGTDITNYSIDERVKLGIKYAFQQPITFKGLTIKELIDIATKQENSIPKACEYLSRVGICAKDYINRDFDKTLSGGEQKRIELALALAQNGNTVIFDEPEAGIDIWSFDRLNKIFEKNKSYIVVSHQTKFLSSADKIVVMQNGKIVQYDDAKTVLKNLKYTTCKKVEE